MRNTKARCDPRSQILITPRRTGNLALGVFQALRGLGRHELSLLLWVAALFGGIWGFVEIAEAVMGQETHALDEALLLGLRSPTDPRDPLGPQWLEEAARDLTALGSVGVLTLVTVGVLVYLLLARHMRAAGFTLAAVGGGMLLTNLLKLGFGRPRPDLVPHAAVVYTASFPSGHAMMAAITYLTLAAMLSRVERRWHIKAYLLLAAVCITVVVGISRVYLGVHWPTDVLAGWSVGAAWAALCWLIARWIQRKASPGI
jgi:undecaprenyl-diphosphatase